jgi:hypothetical protein|tara:strand:+ start:31 stop:1485 length:1455 start_codon:yes stop_codon:yes gene_type:complete
MIPKTIIQTYSTDKLSKEMQKASDSWKTLNPKHNYIFFDDEMCINFIRENFDNDVVKSFDCLIPGAFKADLFRYCFLYVNGGVYIDIDNVCMVPLDDVINDDDSFISVKDDSFGNQGLIYNSFIATERNNPVLKKAIDLIVYNVLNNIYPNSGNKMADILGVSGPRCLAIALNNQINKPIFKDFSVGTTNTDTLKFRLLDVINDGRNITHIKTEDDRVIIKVKYEGYKVKNNYWTLFDMRKVYKNHAPLISCLCVSKNNIKIVTQAIDDFLKQTYVNKELIVVTEKQNINLLELKTLLGVKDRTAKKIKLIVVDNKKYPTLGHLRNLSVENAKGEYVLQWDDDDINHEDRISFMYEKLSQTSKNSCFLRKVTIVDTETNKKYLSRNWGGVEGTMLALRSAMPKYQHLRKGEDTPVRDYFIRKDSHLLLDASYLYTYNFHINNTWDKAHLPRLCDVELEEDTIILHEPYASGTWRTKHTKPKRKK